MGKTLSFKSISSAVAVVPGNPAGSCSEPEVIRDLYGLTEDGAVYRYQIPTKGGNGFWVALSMETKE
jgi:hypothetical protein